MGGFSPIPSLSISLLCLYPLLLCPVNTLFPNKLPPNSPTFNSWLLCVTLDKSRFCSEPPSPYI